MTTMNYVWVLLWLNLWLFNWNRILKIRLKVQQNKQLQSSLERQRDDLIQEVVQNAKTVGREWSSYVPTDNFSDGLLKHIRDAVRKELNEHEPEVKVMINHINYPLRKSDKVKIVHSMSGKPVLLQVNGKTIAQEGINIFQVEVDGMLICKFEQTNRNFFRNFSKN